MGEWKGTVLLRLGADGRIHSWLNCCNLVEVKCMQMSKGMSEPALSCVCDMIMVSLVALSLKPCYSNTDYCKLMQTY